MSGGFRALRSLDDVADADSSGAHRQHYLHPGEWLAASAPTAVTTILASCVAVCLWDVEARIGGLNHFLLPTGARRAMQPARYGNLAIPGLVADLEALGCDRRRLRAKLFGGSCRAEATAGGDLGARNVALADEVLEELAIPVVARDTGGPRARKLVLHTDDFSVWVWRILMDDEHAQLVEAFVADTDDNLERMEAALLALERHPGDAARVNELFRAVHSIKGDASIVGLRAIPALLHGVEDLLDRVRAGVVEATHALVSDLLACVDALRRLVPAAVRGDEAVTAAQAAPFARLAALAQPAAGGAPAARAAAALSDGDGDEHDGEGPRLLRIELAKLDALLTVSGEIAILRQRLRALLPDGATRELQDEIDRLSAQLQDEIMHARMVPVGPIFRPYARTVRDLAAALGKEVQLTVEGGDCGVDAAMIGPVREALTHVVRNAIDHGIEAPAERQARGKSPVGRVILRARHEPGCVVVEVSDDGAGFSRARILARARERLADADRLSDGELLRLVLEPGFSTAERVTDLSGRGVGLDVVRRRLASLRGEVTLQSGEGVGSTVTLRLPLTLAIIDGFYVGVGGQTYVVPLSAVHECIELGADRREEADSGIVSFRGEPLPYLKLRQRFGERGAHAGRQSVVVIRHDGLTAGLAVDALHGEGQTVVKPLGPLLTSVPGISGSTITADGGVALILDVPALLRDAVSRAASTNP